MDEFNNKFLCVIEMYNIVILDIFRLSSNLDYTYHIVRIN